MKKWRGVVGVVLAAGFLQGCFEDKQVQERTTGLPGGKACPRTREMPAAAGPALVTGSVTDTTNSGGYTYLKLATGSGDRWMAMPLTKVAVGDTISVPEGAPMTNFHSPTLGRTFDVIYFSPGSQDRTRKEGSRPCAIALGGDGSFPAGHPPVSGAGGPAPAGSVVTGRVAEVMETSNYTYVQVLSGTNSIWAAAPRFAVAQGDLVCVPLGLCMKDFTSPSTGRSFPVLYMTESIPVLEKVSPPAD